MANLLPDPIPRPGTGLGPSLVSRPTSRPPHSLLHMLPQCLPRTKYLVIFLSCVKSSSGPVPSGQHLTSVVCLLRSLAGPPDLCPFPAPCALQLPATLYPGRCSCCLFCPGRSACFPSSCPLFFTGPLLTQASSPLGRHPQPLPGWRVSWRHPHALCTLLWKHQGLNL